MCVKRDHVAQVWKQLDEAGKADKYFTDERKEIEDEIGNWERFYDSEVQTRKPSYLRVCYLCGDNPYNDLEVLLDNGIIHQNVWAIEKNSTEFKKAKKAIKNSKLRNVKLIKGDILTFLKDFPGQFDIIYLDTCGALASFDHKTLKIIGYVFQHDKLTSPGALITNFSFPPPQENSTQGKDEEREMINFLVKEYMNYRLCNVLLKDNSPENNPEDEDNYGDYVSFQVIDSAYRFIPAQRMLLLEDESLWGDLFSSKQTFLDKINSYNEESTKTTTNKKSVALRKKLKDKCKVDERSSIFFNLRKMVETFHKKLKDYSFCQAWVCDIFPDWDSDREDVELLLKNKDTKIPVFLAPLLFSSPSHIIDFSSDTFVSGCLEPLFNAVADGKFPSCCDMTTPGQAACLIAGLLYGQIGNPSFPVMDKLFRLRYTAKKRQMFADVFIFDKCRYMYEQFPTVHCAHLAIEEPKQHMVFRMVVDGFRKHLGGICSEDLFKFCNVASINAIPEGRVSFPNSVRSIPERQKIEDKL